MAKRYCLYPGCPNLVDRGRCEEHATKRRQRYDERRGSARDRGYDSQWEKVRLMKLKRDPLCERCERNGETKAAQMVHHIEEIPDRPDLRLYLPNLESLCFACHEQITDRTAA